MMTFIKQMTTEISKILNDFDQECLRHTFRKSTNPYDMRDKNASIRPNTETTSYGVFRVF